MSSPLPQSLIARLPHPVVQAPMGGGGSTPALAAAVSSAGGLGFLAAAYQRPETLRQEIELTRSLTDAPFGVNVFVPGSDTPGSAEAVARYRAELAGEAERYGVELPEPPAWDDDAYEDKLDILAETGVALVSFTFGCPDGDVIARLQSAGSEIAVTVTTPAEAVHAIREGADILCVQGPEAGAHRGTFDQSPPPLVPGAPDRPDLPLRDLVPAVRKAVAAEGADAPLLAAGGIMDGADIAAVLAAGADAAMLGTAFLVAPESGAHPLHKAALTDPRWADESFGPSTTVTRAFSGRPARGLVNRFITEHRKKAPACYPQVHWLTASLRRAAAEQEDPDGMSLWAGVGHCRARVLPAGQLVELLVMETAEAQARPIEQRPL